MVRWRCGAPCAYMHTNPRACLRCEHLGLAFTHPCAYSLTVTLHAAHAMWHGRSRAVLAPNGKIYAIPYAAAVVLEIDPDARTAFAFAATSGSGQPSGWAKWAGGVLGANGKIYGIPALATGILEIGVRAGQCDPPLIVHTRAESPSSLARAMTLAPRFSRRSLAELSPELTSNDRRRATSDQPVRHAAWWEQPGRQVERRRASAERQDLRHPVAQQQGTSRPDLTRTPMHTLVHSHASTYSFKCAPPQVLEFDPNTKAIALVGSITSTNFTWHGVRISLDILESSPVVTRCASIPDLFPARLPH